MFIFLCVCNNHVNSLLTYFKSWFYVCLCIFISIAKENSSSFESFIEAPLTIRTLFNISKKSWNKAPYAAKVLKQTISLAEAGRRIVGIDRKNYREPIDRRQWPIRRRGNLALVTLLATLFGFLAPVKAESAASSIKSKQESGFCESSMLYCCVWGSFWSFKKN